MIDINKKYTLDGEPVEVLTTTAINGSPVLVRTVDQDILELYADGSLREGGIPRLVEVPTPVFGYVNIFKDSYRTYRAGRLHLDLQSARNTPGAPIARIKFEINGGEFAE